MSVAFCLSFTERRQSWRRSSLEAINSGVSINLSRL